MHKKKVIKQALDKTCQEQTDKPTKKRHHALIYRISMLVDFYVLLAFDMKTEIGFKINIGPKELQGHCFLVNGNSVMIKNNTEIVSSYCPVICVRNIWKYQKDYIIGFIRHILDNQREERKVKKSFIPKKTILFKQY